MHEWVYCVKIIVIKCSWHIRYHTLINCTMGITPDDAIRSKLRSKWLLQWIHCIWQSHISTKLSHSLSTLFQSIHLQNNSTTLIHGQVKAKGLESSKDILIDYMEAQKNFSRRYMMICQSSMLQQNHFGSFRLYKTRHTPWLKHLQIAKDIEIYYFRLNCWSACHPWQCVNCLASQYNQDQSCICDTQSTRSQASSYQ
jgi:hypothetical protein